MEISKNNYQNSLQEIKEIILKTKAIIETKVNYEKVKMSWNIGAIITKHLQDNHERGYKKQFFIQLANDTNISNRVLYQMQNFYQSYPNLPQPNQSLSWSQYCELSTIKDKRSRNALEKLTISKNLSANDLKKEIKLKREILNNSKSNNETPTLPFKRGKLFCYKITDLGNIDKIYFDCGFNIFGQAINQDFKDGDIVRSVMTSSQFSLQKQEIDKNDLHTYKAKIDKIIDGDTIKVIIDLGFNIKHKEIIRLAKINAPEKNTILGQRASNKLQELLRNQKFIIIKTNKTDIYGRYVGDVFFSPEHETNPDKVSQQGTYLNQLLIDLGVVTSY